MNAAAADVDDDLRSPRPVLEDPKGPSESASAVSAVVSSDSLTDCGAGARAPPPTPRGGGGALAPADLSSAAAARASAVAFLRQVAAGAGAARLSRPDAAPATSAPARASEAPARTGFDFAVNLRFGRIAMNYASIAASPRAVSPPPYEASYGEDGLFW